MNVNNFVVRPQRKLVEKSSVASLVRCKAATTVLAAIPVILSGCGGGENQASVTSSSSPSALTTPTSTNNDPIASAITNYLAISQEAFHTNSTQELARVAASPVRDVESTIISQLSGAGEHRDKEYQLSGVPTVLHQGFGGFQVRATLKVVRNALLMLGER